jgi:SAM-dependent methyltransferase
MHEGVKNWLTPGDRRYAFARCQNPACRHGWLIPPTEPEELYPAAYYTHAPDTPRSAVGRGVAALKRSRVGGALGYVMYLQDMKPGRMLEIGCGTGSRLAELRDRGWDVQGLEPDAAAAAIAKEHFHVPVVVGTLDEAGFAGGSFDAITMTHVIEHIADPLPLLRSCKPLLRPGGKLVVTCPNLDAYGHARYGVSWMALDPPRHEHLFTRDSLAALARAAGFGSVTARTSVRGALGNLVGSEQVRATGNRRGRVSAALRAKGLALSAVEFAHLLRDPLAGEELALIASP